MLTLWRPPLDISLARLTAFGFGIFFAITCILILYTAFYNIYLHPLSKFPGPKLAAGFRGYSAYYYIRGQRAKYSKQLHERYGPIVRVAPDELSVIDEHGWRDIYMHRQGHKQLQKPENRTARRSNGAYSIIVAPDDVHSRQRRLLSHAFSERALREQEPLIQTYVSLLINNLREDAHEKREANMVLYYNLTTFDIVSDLAFGESFGGLKLRSPHPWMKTFFELMQKSTLIGQIRLLGIPLVSKLAMVWGMTLIRKQLGLMSYTKERITKRIEQGTERPDFMHYVLRANETEKGMTRDEIDATFNLLMIAGSETTATLLAGCTYLLQRNPSVLSKLKAEIRDAFENEEDMTMLSTSHLPYLAAVIEEALRFYPPVPISLARVTPPEGDTICGHYVPGGVTIGVPQHAAYHSPLNFSQPDAFIPERWLVEQTSDSPSSPDDFKLDKKQVFQPFSAGPRNCIGKNLAYGEMRLILARVLWNFDFEMSDKALRDGEVNWLDQEVYTLWKKSPLMVKIKDLRA